jgi:catechol 2,3-dioxygenase-like lactoylglutathione lyase family enzyme
MAEDIKIEVSLLVLRCKDLNATRSFYERLGLAFVEERHGKGPLHYAWENAGFVLELYSATEQQFPDNVRLGFSTSLLADVSGRVLHDSSMKVLKSPYSTSNRLVMLLEDPDGRKVEVSQPLHS